MPISTEFSAANSQPMARVRATGSAGSSASLRSAMWSTMAPLSNSTSPSSSIAGACPKGWRARCSGDRCSGPSVIVRTRYGRPASSSAQRTRKARISGAAKSGTQS